MRELFKKFSLDDKTVDFTGHAIALHLNDKYEIYRLYSYTFF